MSFLTDNFGHPGFYMPLRVKPSNAPDVVMVQGFGISARAMTDLARFLKRMGLRSATAPLGGLFGYIQTQSVRGGGDRLADYLMGLPTRPWVIGHSLGGMIARHAIQRTAASSCVRGLITIGTPHCGTPAAVPAVALTLLSRAPLDMVPRSRTIRRLNQLPWPDELPLISLVSLRDPLCVPGCGRVPFEGRRVRNVVFERLGHTEMLRAPEVLGTIASIIRPQGAGSTSI